MTAAVVPASGAGGLAAGARIRVHGVKAKAELNGRSGACVEFLPETSRWSVRLDDGTTFSLKAENLEKLPGPQLRLTVGSASLQGLRSSQEDRHVKIPDLDKAARALKMPVTLGPPSAFFAVYDGHMGQSCAEFAAKNLHLRVLRQLSAAAAEAGGAVLDEARIRGALIAACSGLDTEYLARFRTAPDGCTVLVGVVAGERLFIAWAGDSRALACKSNADGSVTAEVLTEDHKATSPAEAERVKEAGGSVVDIGDGCWRVAQGDYEERCREITRAEHQGLGMIGKCPVALAVSRSMGDRDFKAVTRGKDVVSGVPEVRVLELDRSYTHVILMSDGVTDVMTNDEIVAAVDNHLGPEPPSYLQRSAEEEGEIARMACTSLLQEALRRGSSDNVTAVVAQCHWAAPTAPVATPRPAAAAPAPAPSPSPSPSRASAAAPAAAVATAAAVPQAVGLVRPGMVSAAPAIKRPRA